MIIYFVSALLISAVVFKLGAYATVIGLMVTASKVVVGLVGLVAMVLMWKWYKGSKRNIKFIGRT